MLLAISMAGCDSGGSSGYTPSSPYSQPTTRTVNCAYCNGGGVVLNPYDGNYYYCQNCGGTGKVTVTTGGSNPSFGGKWGRNSDCPRCTSCPGWEKKAPITLIASIVTIRKVGTLVSSKD